MPGEGESKKNETFLAGIEHKNTERHLLEVYQRHPKRHKMKTYSTVTECPLPFLPTLMPDIN